jgi:hypothetical protein
MPKVSFEDEQLRMLPDNDNYSDSNSDSSGVPSETSPALPTSKRSSLSGPDSDSKPSSSTPYTSARSTLNDNTKTPNGGIPLDLESQTPLNVLDPNTPDMDKACREIGTCCGAFLSILIAIFLVVFLIAAIRIAIDFIRGLDSTEDPWSQEFKYGYKKGLEVVIQVARARAEELQAMGDGTAS